MNNIMDAFLADNRGVAEQMPEDIDGSRFVDLNFLSGLLRRMESGKITDEERDKIQPHILNLAIECREKYKEFLSQVSEFDISLLKENRLTVGVVRALRSMVEKRM